MGGTSGDGDLSESAVVHSASLESRFTELKGNLDLIIRVPSNPDFSCVGVTNGVPAFAGDVVAMLLARGGALDFVGDGVATLLACEGGIAFVGDGVAAALDCDEAWAEGVRDNDFACWSLRL